MAIDTGTSLDSGASDITYTGDEGPRSPEQQLMASADPMLVEEYQKYVFEMEEQGQTPISFKQFVQQIMSESRMAGGGIARLGYKRGRVVEPGGYQGNPHRDGPPGDASGGGGEGGWDDRVSSAAEDFHSTDTAADFADLGGGGGGQDHDWSNDIGTVGTVGLSPVTTGGISDIDPRFINNLKYASAIKKPFLQTQPWYNKPLNFQTAPKYNIRSYSLGSLDPAGEKGLVGLYDELRDKNLTIGDALGLMETGKYDVLGDKITTDLREHLLENIDFGDTFKEGAGLTNPFGLGTVDPTFKGNILNIDPSKLQDDEARKYLEVAQGGIARLGYDMGGRIPFKGGGKDAGTRSFAESLGGQAYADEVGQQYGFSGGAGSGEGGHQTPKDVEKEVRERSKQDQVLRDIKDEKRKKSLSKKIGDKLYNLRYKAPVLGKMSYSATVKSRLEHLHDKGYLYSGDEDEGILWDLPEGYEKLKDLDYLASGEGLRALRGLDYVPGVELWGPEGEYTARAAGAAIQPELPLHARTGIGEGTGITRNISPLAQAVDATGTTVTSPWSTDVAEVTDASTGVHIPGAANFYSNLDPSVFDPATEIYTAAHGGRVPAAYGGIMDTATGRRRYGLGSIFKKAKKAVKKITKSPLGKLGLLALGGWGLSKTGMLSGLKDSSFLKSILLKGGKGPWELANISPWKAIGGLSALGGAYTAMAPEEDDDDYLKWHEKEKAKYLAQMGGPWPTDPVQFTAQGGRIGYANGGNDEEEDLYLDYIARRSQEGSKYSPSRSEYESYVSSPIQMGGAIPPGGLDEIRRQRAERGPGIFKVPAAQGGRIGYAGGGNDEDEEEQHIGRRLAQEGGLMNLGGRIGYKKGGDETKAMERAKIDLEKIMASFLKKRGPLYINPDHDLDIPLTEFEKALRKMSKEEREEELGRLQSILRQRGNIGRDLAIPGGGKTGKERRMELLNWGTDRPSEDTGYFDDYSMRHRAAEYLDRPYSDEHYETGEHFNKGGRVAAQEGGLMDMGGMEKDYRQEGGFVPIGGQEKADDVPARLSKNEFVFTADAVRAAGGGDIDAGAEVMENVMNNLERGGQVSEESQGLEGARNMFATAKRLEGVL